MSFVPFGDRAVRFEIPPRAARRDLFAVLANADGVRDVVLTEEIGCVVFAAGADRSVAARALAACGDAGPRVVTPRRHEIDVVYDGEDLSAVAAALGRREEDVVSMHAERDYDVAMLGFMPGFGYLRDLDDALVLPRRAPRPRVPAGSVAIAARYTAVYPFASPGGWHLLGRAVGFEAFGDRGAALADGDRVRFRPTRDRHAPDPPKRSTPPPLHGPRLEITRAAGLAILVDDGRFGRMHEGVPPGGPLVRSAFARANALAKNAAGACAVEIAGILEVVARGGRVRIADEGGTRDLDEGDRHVVSTSGKDRVRYLAIHGGVDAPVVLGGRGALLGANIGAPLRRGDGLAPGAAAGEEAVADTPHPAIAIMQGPDVVAGASACEISAHAYRISTTSSRAGTRLEGPLAASASSGPSTPMVVGAVELTPSGLVVLGPDHPTTGGYPVVAVLASASLDTFFSQPLGATVRFEPAR